MSYFKVFIITIIISIPYIVAAKDGRTPASEAWNDSAGFQTSHDILTKSLIAELIEKKENGFYDGWNQNNTFITNIGTQNTNIGAQTIFNDSDLDDVFVATTNCGQPSIVSSADSSGTNKVSNAGVRCTVESTNASNP